MPAVGISRHSIAILWHRSSMLQRDGLRAEGEEPARPSDRRPSKRASRHDRLARHDPRRDPDRARDQAVGDQPVPDPVQLDGADAPLRERRRLPRAAAASSTAQTASSPAASVTSSEAPSAATSSSSTPHLAQASPARRRRLRQAPDRPARRHWARRTATSTSTGRSSTSHTSSRQYRDQPQLPAMTDPARALLHDGRQPQRLMRLTQVGNRAPPRSDRQGHRHLLAPQPHLDPLARQAGPTITIVSAGTVG